jgi:hypothetical protein
VSCYNSNREDGIHWDEIWRFNHSKLENYKGYLKSNDIINLSIRKRYDNDKVEFLRSHNIQFTIGNDSFQEVVCYNNYNKRLEGIDEVSNFILFYFI